MRWFIVELNEINSRWTIYAVWRFENRMQLNICFIYDLILLFYHMFYEEKKWFQPISKRINVSKDAVTFAENHHLVLQHFHVSIQNLFCFSLWSNVLYVDIQYIKHETFYLKSETLDFISSDCGFKQT